MFINLTPHAIVVRLADGDTTFPASGTACRVTSNSAVVGEHDGIAIMATAYSGVANLPEPVEGVRYIVSGMVRSALGATRPDVVSPDSGPSAFRDVEGRIVAVRAFIGVA